jgi:cytochrome P450
MPPLEVDPPEHGVFRKLLQRFWLPSRIKAMEPSVRASAIELIDRLVMREQGDLARELAYPLPVMALCTLLGVEREHWDNIKTWSEASLAFYAKDEGERNAALAAHEALMDHARSLVADRLRQPRDPESDIASALLAAGDHDPVIDHELIAGVLRLLISAGHNSTTNASGNILLYLADHPEAQALLRAEPARIPAAIEELLRLESPVQEMPRFATRDAVIGGRAIKAGDRLGLLWGAGNRDPEVFDQPDVCVLDRKPNRHLTFGYGTHTCLGAPMARMELRVMVEELLARTSHIKRVGPALRQPYHHMGVAALPVTLRA